MGDQIQVRGARVHNLADVDVTIPRDKLVVFTGLSGSGKSSLAFDTIYAEGQRRYVESLSAYARQFLGQMDKPDVDTVDGLSPAISIDQKSTSHNPRSTVGTVTEIHDHLRLLFARIGQPHCPTCHRPVVAQPAADIVDTVAATPDGHRLQIGAPLVRSRKGTHKDLLERLANDGFTRITLDGELCRIEDAPELDKNVRHDITVIVDRVVTGSTSRRRLSDAVELALELADGQLTVEDLTAGTTDRFSEHLACAHCQVSYPALEPRTFSFNSPYGACPTCTGLGVQPHVDLDALAARPNEPVPTCFALPNPQSWRTRWIRKVLRGWARTHQVADTPYRNLDDTLLDQLVNGDPATLRVRQGRRTVNATFSGLTAWLAELTDDASEKLQATLDDLLTSSPCPSCAGSRLRPLPRAVTIADTTIGTLVEQPIGQLAGWFGALELSDTDQHIAGRLIAEIRDRLTFLVDVGLDYLSLSRTATTLSGGEAQRIRLATQIGAGLVGVLYVLDEPSIGLHARDNDRLLGTLERLRDLGNTVIVVEHDEDTIRAADHIVDIGPGAGEHGGQVVHSGTVATLERKTRASLTGAYLAGVRTIPLPTTRRAGNGNDISIEGASGNNLAELDVTIPIGTFTCVTGVSGSGKSTLVNDTLAAAGARHLNQGKQRPATHRTISGLDHLDKQVVVNQAPIGRTPRSNPATYIGVFDHIRKLFAATPDAKARGWKPGRFSFNVKGGRCETCQGDGALKIEMHFLADVYVPCASCDGARYNTETLEVTFRGKTIADVLGMTAEQAAEFFVNQPTIRRHLDALVSVGLGYVRLGQAATTLSGGEAQRVKLANELKKVSTGSTLYILDEPTTGLHFDDIRRLLEVLHQLVERGNTVVVIEHDLHVIKTADYLIDLGPEGGDGGGTLVGCGTPEQLAANESSHTGRHLAPLLDPPPTPR